MRINIPKLPVLTTEQGINEIRNNLDYLNDWKDIYELIPKSFLNNSELKKTGITGIFAASLELTKEGVLSLMQEKAYDKLMIKKNNK